VTVQRTASSGLGSLSSGAVTAAATAVQTGLAALVGVIIAREFGRSAETDGFFVAYGLFIVVVLAANAIRVTILPALARARDATRLAGETASYAVVLTALALPLLVVSIFASDEVARLLTADGSRAARETASAALPLMAVGAVAQLYAGLAAGALAALDDYVVAAGGYALASVLGLAVILLRLDADGIQAVALGMVVTGVVALAVPVAELALRARRTGAPRAAVRPSGRRPAARLPELGRGVALPLAMQAVYVVSLPFAAREGVGAVTSFGYAYLATAGVVGVAASSLGLVTTVPLARAGIDAGTAARHVVSSSWLALVCVGAVAGVFGLAGENILRAFLGDSFASDIGEEVGHLVVALSPWAVVAVGFSVTFPLLFVSGHGRRLPALAGAVLAGHVPLAWASQEIAGLVGLATAFAVSTGLALAWMLHSLHALRSAAVGLARAALTVGAFALVCFGIAGVALPPVPAAAVGAVAYAALLGAVRPPGLRAAWRYLRVLA
jgi:hypothetical protein